MELGVQRRKTQWRFRKAFHMILKSKEWILQVQGQFSELPDQEPV